MLLFELHIQIYWRDLENEINHLFTYNLSCRITQETKGCFCCCNDIFSKKNEILLSTAAVPQRDHGMGSSQHRQDARAIFMQHNMNNMS